MGLPIYLRGLQDNPDRAVLTLNQLLAKACVALKFVLSKVMADMVDEPNWITLYPMAKADATIEMEPTGLGIAKMATSSANVVTETSGAVATEVSHAATDVSHTLTATKTADATPTQEVEAVAPMVSLRALPLGPHHSKDDGDAEAFDYTMGLEDNARQRMRKMLAIETLTVSLTRAPLLKRFGPPKVVKAVVRHSLRTCMPPPVHFLLGRAVDKAKTHASQAAHGNRPKASEQPLPPPLRKVPVADLIIFDTQIDVEIQMGSKYYEFEVVGRRAWIPTSLFQLGLKCAALLSRDLSQRVALSAPLIKTFCDRVARQARVVQRRRARLVAP